VRATRNRDFPECSYFGIPTSKFGFISVSMAYIVDEIRFRP
jgi:hypothetical protein